MLQTFFNLEIIGAAWRIILAGLGNTVMLSLVVVPLGLFGGLVLAMLASVRNPWLRWPLMAWVDFFRAFPPLVLLIFLFAGLPFAGLELGGFACVCIAFFLNTGAYYGEILRAGIESVPSGQTEAARSTGLGRVQTMLFVVLPQAVRKVIPPLLNDFIGLQKDTALVSFIGVVEVFSRTQIVAGGSFNFTPYLACGLIFLLMTIPMARFVDWLAARDRKRQLATIAR